MLTCCCSVYQSCLILLQPHAVARQAPLSMGFCRQEYWSGLPFPTPGDLPNPEIKPASPVLPVLPAESLLAEPPGKPRSFLCTHKKKMHVQSCLTLCDPPWTVACQAAVSMEISRQEYWRGLSFPSPGGRPDPGIEPSLPHDRQMLYHLSHQASQKIERRAPNSTTFIQVMLFFH